LVGQLRDPGAEVSDALCVIDRQEGGTGHWQQTASAFAPCPRARISKED